MSKPPAARGHSRKHSRNRPRKHHQHPAHSKHNPGHQAQGAGASGSGGPQKVHTVAHHHQQPKPRGFSPGYDTACCAAEALGTLLALSGRPWSHEDTLSLYWRTASHPDAGASILATLGASEERLAFAPVDPPDEIALPRIEHGQLAAQEHLVGEPLHLVGDAGHGVILGVTLPEPHAVAVAPDGTWWSWGEPFDPDDWLDLAIEEAWAVSL